MIVLLLILNLIATSVATFIGVRVMLEWVDRKFGFAWACITGVCLIGLGVASIVVAP